MLKERDKHVTLAARHSRRLLRDLVVGLWDFMAQLDLDEAEVEVICEEMLEFTTFARSMDLGDGEFEKYFVPQRKMDHDCLVMKMKFRERIARDEQVAQ